MVTNKVATKIRPLSLEDLDVIFMIDHKIRNSGKAITYKYLTTEHIFTINRKVSRMKQPISYLDLVTGDVSELLNYGFAAEVEGHVRGFILGKVERVGESATRMGEILILGVHPDYWHRGIATDLVRAICKKYNSMGIRTVKIEIDHRDKALMGFCEQMDFSVGHRIEYTRTL